MRAPVCKEEAVLRVSRVAAMPDVHLGVGSTIGSVIQTGRRARRRGTMHADSLQA